MIEAGHPIPDAAGLAAAEKALQLAESAGADDLVLVLMSGGASANWIAPAEGVSFADKQAVTRALLRSGANIGEINTVRKHLSRIKGGRLARRAYPARLATIAISDVPRRRSVRDRLRADGARPDDARRCARHRRQIQARSCRRASRARSTTRRMNRRSPATRFSPTPTLRSPRGRPMPCAPRKRPCAPPATSAVMLGDSARRRGARGRGEPCEARPRSARARQTRRHPLRRRTDRHHPRQGPRRAQPGICAGAGHRPCRHAGGGGARRRHRRHRRRRRRSQRPGRRPASMARPWRAPRPPASILPPFLPTTIRPDFSPPSRTC